MLMSLCSSAFFAPAQIGSLVQRVSHGRVEIERALLERWRVDGPKLTFQNSGDPGARTNVRRLSCASLIAASATITLDSLVATSACAWTMSIGAIVPISTRFWLSFNDCSDNASDSCCAFRLPIAYARSQCRFGRCAASA